MHPMQPLLHVSAQLKHAIAARNYPGTALWAARLAAPVAITWATDSPDDPIAAAEFARRAAPVLDNLHAAAAKLAAWESATGRRGVEASTLWVALLVAEAIRVLSVPGADDDRASVAAIVPDKPGPAVISARSV